MLNSRTLFPALFGTAGGGGGGSGQTIQVTELPEAVLAEKDKIYQYIGSTTETLTNGYFYKCVEHTTTEGETITVTYSWENIPVMEVDSGGGIALSENEMQIGTLDNVPLYAKLMTFICSGSQVVLPENYKIQWYDAIFQRKESGVTYDHWYKGGNGQGNIEIDNATGGLTFYINETSWSRSTVKLFIVYTKN